MLDDPEWGQWSDREIAKACAVSHTFVASVRNPVTAQKRSENRAKSAVKQVEPAPVATPAPVAPPAPPTDAEQVAQEAHGDVGVAIRWPIGSVRPRPVEPGSSPELEVEPAPLGPEASSLPPGGFSSFESR
ncbi:hypothetical protein [Piscinibacter defluvii]|uniref:hypothetical protein n=1 Tax=Piscinibacter defluvii TaxID=1796922 RepID=UPI0013E29288|nr:hypothetical protein [Piscinibacter defluvii]